MSIEDKHFEHIAKMKSLESMSKWYSWDSPIGLSTFFVSLFLSIGLFLVLLHMAGLIG